MNCILQVHEGLIDTPKKLVNEKLYTFVEMYIIFIKNNKVIMESWVCINTKQNHSRSTAKI